MSKKVTEQQASNATPFFAHLLSSNRDPASMAPDDGPAPTYICIDELCTKKYPSDEDESTTWTGDKD